MPTFDHDDPKYKCGSGCCRATTACIIIGVLEVAIASALLANVAWHSDDVKKLGVLVLSLFIIFSSLTLLSALTMFYGIYNRKASFLLPHLLTQIVCMICLFIVLIFAGLSYAILKHKTVPIDEASTTLVPADRKSDVVNFEALNPYMEILHIITWTVVAVCCFIFLAEIWIFSIVLACYRYIRDRAQFGRCQTTER